MIDPLPIPDPDKLFRWFSPNQFDLEAKKPISGAFTDFEMSTIWEHFAKAPDLLTGSRKNFGIVHLIAGDMRHKCGQTVCHTPSRMHKGHSTVIGNKNSKVLRRKIRDFCQLEIYPTPQ